MQFVLHSVHCSADAVSEMASLGMNNPIAVGWTFTVPPVAGYGYTATVGAGR